MRYAVVDMASPARFCGEFGMVGAGGSVGSVQEYKGKVPAEDSLFVNLLVKDLCYHCNKHKVYSSKFAKYIMTLFFRP